MFFLLSSVVLYYLHGVDTIVVNGTTEMDRLDILTESGNLNVAAFVLPSVFVLLFLFFVAPLQNYKLSIYAEISPVVLLSLPYLSFFCSSPP